MTTRNDITGDLIATKTQTKAYSDGWDRIFAKTPAKPEEEIDETSDIQPDSQG